MKRHATIPMILAAMLTTTTMATPAAEAGPQLRKDRTYVPKVIPVPTGGRAPHVEVWTRPGEGAVLYNGQTVDIQFEVDRSAYVVVYNVDTRGRVRKLFPTDRRDDGFVHGGDVVRLPGRHADYRLIVSGPPGIERIVALASTEPIAHRWRELAEDDLAYGAGTGRRGGVFRGSYDRGGFSGEVVIRTGTDPYGKPTHEFTGGDRVPGPSRPYTPKLVPVPRVRRQDVRIDRSETWFEIGRRFGYRY